MKKKFISAILIGALLASTSFVKPQAVYAEDLQPANVMNIENRGKANDLSAAKESINGMAQLITGKINNNYYKQNVYNADSVQYAIMDGDKVIVSGSAEKEGTKNDKPITADTMYGIGSVSKMYVTAAVMQLVDEGKIHLDVPIINYIPEFKMADDNYVKITPRMLLNHSSGLKSVSLRGFALIDDNNTELHDNFLSYLAKQKLNAEPGEFSVYCNDGFELAEILVEKVSGMSFTDYITENITKKLGLKGTNTPLNMPEGGDFAKTFVYNPDGDPHINMMEIGAGGISSTAEELCKFTRAITRKDGQGLLSEKSVDAMGQSEAIKGVWVTDGEDNSFNYGLGWDSVNLFPFNRYGIKACGKGGDAYVYHSYVLTIPEYNLSMAVVSSNGSSLCDSAFASASLLKVLQAKGIIKETLPDVKFASGKSECAPSYLDDYSGVYNLGTGLAHVSIKNGVLEVPELGIAGDYAFHHTYSNYFMYDGLSTGVRFVKEKNNKVYLELKKYMTLPGLIQTSSADYMGQKLEPQDEAADAKAWQDRSKEVYFSLDDRYSSLFFIRSNGIANCSVQPSPEGYVFGDKIISDNEAVSVAQIPGLNGRDAFDLKYYTENGKDYGECSASKLEGYNTLASLLENTELKDGTFTKEITIDDDGYTKWFKVPEELNDYKISVEASDKTAYLHYTKEGALLNDSYFTKVNNDTIHAGEVTGFAGDKGQTFKITITK